MLHDPRCAVVETGRRHAAKTWGDNTVSSEGAPTQGPVCDQGRWTPRRGTKPAGTDPTTGLLSTSSTSSAVALGFWAACFLQRRGGAVISASGGASCGGSVFPRAVRCRRGDPGARFGPGTARLRARAASDAAAELEELCSARVRRPPHWGRRSSSSPVALPNTWVVAVRLAFVRGRAGYPRRCGSGARVRTHGEEGGGRLASASSSSCLRSPDEGDEPPWAERRSATSTTRRSWRSAWRHEKVASRTRAGGEGLISS